MPTSMIMAPSLTISAVKKLGTPNAETTMSASLVIAARFCVLLCVRVTVAFPGFPFSESKILMGLPTI